jgi:O-antigen/teichoic acid export membrane protein
MKQTQTHDLVKNTVLLSAGSLLNKGLQFVIIPIFSAWLSKEDYGTYDLLSSYVTLLIPLVTLAISEAIFRMAIDVDDKIEKGIYITNSLLLVVVNLFIVALVLLFIYPRYSWSLTLPFIALLVGEVINNYLQGYMRAIKKLNIYSFFMAITTVLIIICVTVFVYFFKTGLPGMIAGYAAGYLVGDLVIILWTRYWQYLKISAFSLRVLRDMLRYSLPLVPNNISWWVVNASDRFIINMFFGAGANGIFAIAHKIPSLCSSVFGMFSISWQQTASDIVDDADRDSYYTKVLNQMISFLITICAVILSLNFFLFHVIFDAKYFEAYLYAPILITSIIFYSLSQFYGGIQISMKKPKENGITTVIGAVTNIMIHLILIRFIGLYAAAISTFVANFQVFILRHVRLKKTITISLSHPNCLRALIYVYFLVTSYFVNAWLWNFLNVALAVAFFTFTNRTTIFSILKKLKMLRKDKDE